MFPSELVSTPPFVHVFYNDPLSWDDYHREHCRARATLAAKTPGALIRLLRGKRMRSVEGLFGEVAAALQFPWYFGENWPAFDECLGDLDWLDFTAVLLVVLEAEQVLADEPECEMRVLMEVIARATEERSRPNQVTSNRLRPAQPFHVVFHLFHDPERKFSARLRATGAQFDE